MVGLSINSRIRFPEKIKYRAVIPIIIGTQGTEGEIDGVLHPGIEFSGIGVADNRHTALRETKGHLHGNLIDFLSNAHSCHSIWTINGSQVV